MLEAFAEVVGQGDPVTAAEAYWMQLAATLQAGSGPTGVCGAGGWVRGGCVWGGGHKGLSVVSGGAWLSFGGGACAAAHWEFLDERRNLVVFWGVYVHVRQHSNRQGLCAAAVHLPDAAVQVLQPRPL